MAVTELLAPVPSAVDYAVSIDLWERLENEIKLVSDRIEAGEELVPEDVANVKKLKTQVDAYVASFNAAMRNAQSDYRKLVDKRLTELGYDTIEQFITKKKQEQTSLQNQRISDKLEHLNQILTALLANTRQLKNTALANELLPIFTARFPKIQSGAKSNEIHDWKPYIAVISRVILVMDTFFSDPKYEGAKLLPLHSGTIRELLAYARDGREERLAAVPLKFRQDQHFIRDAKLRSVIKSKEDGIVYIRRILNNLQKTDEAIPKEQTEQAWEQISLIVGLVNTR